MVLGESAPSLPSNRDGTAHAPIGRVFAIKRYAIHDGPGIRVTVFLQGCPLRCIWCHNPEGRDNGEGCERASTAAGDDRFAVREMTAADVVREVEKDILFLDESGGGVTFSGGEPLGQPEFLRAALRACKEHDLHTAVDTCGYAPAEVFDSIVDDVDLFLYDLKLIDDQRHREFAGVSNETILANLKNLVDAGRNIMIRFPIIPQITDTDDNLGQTLDLIESLGGISDVAILPYHRTAEGKYERLNVENRMEGVETLSDDRIESIRMQFESRGLRVAVGG